MASKRQVELLAAAAAEAGVLGAEARIAALAAAEAEARRAAEAEVPPPKYRARGRNRVQYEEDWPAEVWPVTAFIREELRVRDWPEEVLVRLMLRPSTWSLADLRVAPLSDGNAARLERALGLPKQFFLGMDQAYLDCKWSGLYEEAPDGALVKKP